MLFQILVNRKLKFSFFLNILYLVSNSTSLSTENKDNKSEE